jgi:hypothetical protein
MSKETTTTTTSTTTTQGSNKKRPKHRTINSTGRTTTLNAYELTMAEADKNKTIEEQSGELELAQTVPPNDVAMEEAHLESTGEKDAMLTDSMIKKQTTNDDAMDDVDMIVDERSGRSVNISASLTPSTYSIIFVTRVCSWSFWYAIFVFCFQITLAALTLADLVDWEEWFEGGVNTINVPANVSGPVRIAGYMCMILAVVYFTDLVRDRQKCNVLLVSNTNIVVYCNILPLDGTYNRLAH